MESSTRFRPWHLALLALLIVGTIYIAIEYNNKPTTSGKGWETSSVIRSEGSVFGTFYHITYHHSENLQNEIDSVLRSVDFSLSPFNPQSIITAVNENRPVTLDSHFVSVFQLAAEVSRQTNGAFDITVAPLVNAWGFGFKNAEQITDARIDSLLEFVGMHHVRLDSCGIVHKDDSRVQLDCSAIAKGYAVDAVGLYLESQGVVDYMVEIGGEIRTRGHNPEGQLWKIGVTTPEDDSLTLNTNYQDILSVTDLSMATSGNYRNYYERGNRKYAHTIDPRVGRPVQHSILSSTVLASDCALADAYATAFMVLGLDSARQILKQHPELQAYFIYSDTQGSTAVWSNFKNQQ